MRTRLILGALSSLLIAACGTEANPPVGPTTPTPNPGAPNKAEQHAFIWSESGGTREIPLPSYAGALAVTDINDAGEVIGTVTSNGTLTDGFVWSEARGFKRTGNVGNVSGGVVLKNINSSGVIVGFVSPRSGSYLSAVVWSRDTGLIPPSGADFGATAVNDSGTIVGYSGSPVTWNKNTGFQPLKAALANCTVATSINDSGEILGWYGDDVNGFGCYPSGYVIWRNRGDPVEVIKCPQSKGCELELFAINNRGEAVGHLNRNAIRLRTREGQQPQLLADFIGTANDINDAGDVAVEFKSLPYIWSAAGELRQLPLLAGTTYGSARAINNRGQVVGTMR